ncbi:MAG: peptidoglycan editing factor PgeF [Patescibacteria group bacterium]|nr:peptidoglycan editing factor PgeF [Patescibacteria group bacterium]
MIKFLPEENYFFSSLINDENYFSGFSAKILGDGRKIETLIRFFSQENINFLKIIIPEQIHSANVALVPQQKDDYQIEKIEEVDGLITNKARVLLIVRTADCLPIIYVEKEKGVVAISHNGWRGTIKKISKNIVEKMISLGADKKKIKVAIGPGIGSCCYKIDEDRYFQFKTEFDGYSEKIFVYRGSWYLNLALLNYLLLLDWGIKKENIDFFPFCTFCDKKRFFSFRRDKGKKEYGEMFSFIIKY